uniref:Uncharacterized protein n=1 Tax=Oryzias latipes TaxID=8090 RepID=A0A3P9K639_ORYLA
EKNYPLHSDDTWSDPHYFASVASFFLQLPQSRHLCSFPFIDQNFSSVNSEEQSLTCRELQGAASQRRAELLHHHHAVFVERPLQHGDDSHPCREPVTVQGKCFLHSYETHKNLEYKESLNGLDMFYGEQRVNKPKNQDLKKKKKL